MSEDDVKNEDSWSSLKKTLIGTLSTIILGGGTWVTTTLFGSESKSEESPKIEVPAPVQAPAPVINVNLENNNNNEQKMKSGGTTTIIKEKEVIKEQPKSKVEKPKEEDPW